MLFELLCFVAFLLLILGFRGQARPKNYPPGPVGIPILGYLPFLAPDSHVKIGKLGKKYGSVFSMKMGQYWFVILNDYEVIKEAFRRDEFSGRPNHLLAMAIANKGIVYNYGPECAELRRFVLKSLKNFGFGKNSMVGTVQEEAKDLINYFRKQVGKPIVVRDIISISALNSLWAILAGQRFELDDPEPRRFYKLAKQGLTEPNMQGPVYFLPWMARLAPELTGYSDLLEAARTLKGLIRKLIEEHQKQFVPGETPRDFIDVYLQRMFDDAQDPTSYFYGANGMTNFVDIILNLFIGGSDTLSCTMGFAFLYLTSNPRVIRRAQEEIDQVIGQSRLPEPEDRPKLPYLECVMAEILRLSSIVAGAVLHSTTQDVEFMGFHLPKGTIVMPNLYQVHHCEKTWGDPEEFRPERFLTPDGTFNKDLKIIPFGIGKRSCLAEGLAQMEYFIFLSSLLQHFNFEAHPDYPLPDYDAKPSFILSSKKYRILISERA